MKYNYVIFGSKADYYRVGYSEINDDLNYAQYYYDLDLGNIISFVHKIHMSSKIKKYIDLPLKSFWNKYLFKNSFDSDKPLCFVFFSSGVFTEHIPYGFIEYLRSIYSNSKFVVFYQDLVGTIKRTVPIESFKEIMDLVISFDYADCKKYELLYHPLVYSDITNNINALDLYSDIYFCGAAKNRLSDILHAYEFFKEKGFVCDFIVISSDKELLCKKERGIKYCSSFSYYDNLRHIKSCKCMLEIMQKGGTGFTIRALESIAFNKKLITNNDYIQQADFFDKNNICIYNKLEDNKNLHDFIDTKATSYLHMNSIKPSRLIEFIDERL